jgi:outer membrane protein assembly factor BamC
LGGEPEAAKAALDKPALQSRAKMATEGGQSSLVLNDAFEQAWRRVGLSLDRNNFTVEDRDRSKGIYFVRFVNADAEKDAPGFFARMFGAKAKEGLQKYQILVKAESSTTRVQVAAADGQLATTEDAKSILKVLSDDLK